MNNKLFVGNLAWATSEGALQDAFSAYGNVQEVTIMMDKFSGRSRGFGFVTMSTSEEADAAVKALDNAELDGRPIKVNIARPKEDRPSGGGGGGGFGGGRGGGFRGNRGGGGRRDFRGERSERY